MTHVVTTNLTRGEVSPAIIDRQDEDFYNSAAATMRNWLADTAGQIFTRPALQQLFILPRQNVFDGEDYTWSKSAVRPFTVGGVEYVTVFDWYNQEQPTSSPVSKMTVTVHDASSGAPLAGSTYTMSTASEPDDLSSAISSSTAGPAMFYAAEFIYPGRIAVQVDGTVTIEDSFPAYQQLFGLVTPESGGVTWTGEDTIFQDQLVPGSTVLFRDQTYTVASVTSQTEFTTTTSFTGGTVSDRMAVLDDDFFSTVMGGRPRLVQFYAGRLIFFTTAEKPTGMWASQVGQPFILGAAGTEDDAPINVEYFTEGLDSFTHSVAASRLYLGSANGEYAIGSSESGLTPATASIDLIGSDGAAHSPAVTTGDVVFFINAPRTQVLAGQYDDNRKAVITEDISFLSPHLLEAGARHMAYRPSTGDDRTPRLLLAVGNSLVSCGVSMRHNVVSWTPWDVGGYDVAAVGASKTTAYVIVNDDDYVILSRVQAVGAESFLLDLARAYAGAPIVQVLAPQMGKTLGVYSHEIGFLGYYTPDELGRIYLEADWPGLSGPLSIGLPYAPVLRLLPAKFEDTQGPRLNRKRRVVRTHVDVLNTPLLYINNTQVIGNASAPTGTDVVPKTGVFSYRSLGWSYQDRTEISVPPGYPATIRSITREVV